MYFKKHRLYHVFNQGNNRDLIFFNDRNYRYFIEKIKQYILPYADILAWCLLPNHFHLMIYVKDVELPLTQGLTRSELLSSHLKIRRINDSIGIMLRSYTRAVNKEQDRTGSLFRQETKALCLNKTEELTPAWYTKNGATYINIQNPDLQYPQVCFNYIHMNPVNHGIVVSPEDWQFSSYLAYKKGQSDNLVNFKRAKEFKLHLPGNSKSPGE